jgi:hypothetical protein
MPFTNDDARILALRPPKNEVDPAKPYAFLVEPERTREGTVEDTAVLFLTNRECPFRCLMCDLWKNTTDRRVPDGAIAGQIEYALTRLPPARHVKLYNSGNFFDRQAISPEDHVAILALTERLSHRVERGRKPCPKLERRSSLSEQDVEPVDDSLATGLACGGEELLGRKRGVQAALRGETESEATEGRAPVSESPPDPGPDSGLLLAPGMEREREIAAERAVVLLHVPEDPRQSELVPLR